jgi:hypothetical protein
MTKAILYSDVEKIGHCLSYLRFRTVCTGGNILKYILL